MTMISFKARITGIDNIHTRIEFNRLTKDSLRHEVVYLGEDKDTGWDTFALKKDGNITVPKYTPMFIKKENGEYSLEKLIKIFNILKVKEAEQYIRQSRKSKKEKEFEKLMQEIEEEEKADKIKERNRKEKIKYHTKCTIKKIKEQKMDEKAAISFLTNIYQKEEMSEDDIKNMQEEIKRICASL